MLEERIFSYEDFMELLGIDGEFVGLRNVIASLKDPCPRVEVLYRPLESTVRSEE